MADLTGSGAGFVDYYELLGVPPTAGHEELQTRINDLYSEAQANRNHRQIEKRRYYESLIETLPQARNIILDDSKRARYDAYASEARLGRANPPFATFITQLNSKGAPEPDRVDVLGVAETTTRPERDKAKAATATPRKKGPSERARASLMGTAISVIIFFVVFGVTFALTKNIAEPMHIGIALLIGALVGVIAWFVTHRPSDKIST